MTVVGIFPLKLSPSVPEYTDIVLKDIIRIDEAMLEFLILKRLVGQTLSLQNVLGRLEYFNRDIVNQQQHVI